MEKTIDEFLADLIDILQTEEELNSQTILTDLEEWDSLSAMGLMAYFDRNFQIRLTFEHLSSCKFIVDIINLAQNKIKD